MYKNNIAIRRRKVKKYKNYNKKKQFEQKVINTLSIVVIFLIFMYIKNKYYKSDSINIPIEVAEKFAVPDNTLKVLYELSNKNNLKFAEVVALYSIENNFYTINTTTPTIAEIENSFINNYKYIKRKYASSLKLYVDLFDDIFNDIKTFPISDEFLYTYGDGWGSTRIYGGDRTHKGTDIMSKDNKRGIIKIISMTDGIIENIGWNELGGFRIGVRSNNDNYYYYAHLDSFNDKLTKGDKITAGDFIGYMGDTGYSKIVGTKGNFPVHLHIGISPNTKLSNEEFWINPYPFLKFIE